MAINDVIYGQNFKKIKAEMEKQPCIDDITFKGKTLINTAREDVVFYVLECWFCIGE